MRAFVKQTNKKLCMFLNAPAGLVPVVFLFPASVVGAIVTDWANLPHLWPRPQQVARQHKSTSTEMRVKRIWPVDKIPMSGRLTS